MATHSSILAWKILWTEEPGGLASMGLQRVGHDRSDLAAAAGRLSGFNGIPGGSDSKESAYKAGEQGFHSEAVKSFFS